MELGQKKGRGAGQPLRRPDGRQSSYAYDKQGAGRCSSRHPICQGSPSRIRGKGLSSREQTGACVPSQAAPRQSSKRTTRAAVLAMTSTHGSRAFWRISGSKAAVGGARRRDRRPPSRRDRPVDAPLFPSLLLPSPPPPPSAIKGTLQTRAASPRRLFLSKPP